jgi:uncharacterized protein
VQLISIGNGTASRETDKLVGDLMAGHPELSLVRAVVSEAGASVYSASELGARELPNLDVSLRGAVSIARRLQDPLAELVRIEPRAIGVGQYQHDVSQLEPPGSSTRSSGLQRGGRDVSTARRHCWRISGLNDRSPSTSCRSAMQRVFKNRRQLLKVSRWATVLSAVGRIPADHQRREPARRFRCAPGGLPGRRTYRGADCVPLRELIGKTAVLAPQAGGVCRRSVQRADRQGHPPSSRAGRDPRPEFKTAAFKDNVRDIRDLEAGMTLEGVVTNVANFGAFVDIGVHQDGLVHVSQLADRFVKDPRDVVKTGDIVKVTVVEVDLKRQRISLTMKRPRADAAGGAARPSAPVPASGRTGVPPAPKPAPTPAAPGTRWLRR